MFENLFQDDKVDKVMKKQKKISKKNLFQVSPQKIEK